ncbi:MAG: heavy-metal-associated domain-containing protein, partial [Bacteroidetes bacterium]|nr:heavy-metal-associated domain-containing protein [Bacteroidota bacterium]
MAKKTYKFKTNINCSGCVENVKPFLNSLPEILQWEVETSNKDKVLTVETETLEPEKIEEAIQRSGYKIEPLQQ